MLVLLLVLRFLFPEMRTFRVSRCSFHSLVSTLCTAFAECRISLVGSVWKTQVMVNTLGEQQQCLEVFFGGQTSFQLSKNNFTLGAPRTSPPPNENRQAVHVPDGRG